MNSKSSLERKGLESRITLNPDICHGKPSIRNSRYTVESIVEYLASGDTIEDILSEFKDLEKNDILACLAYTSMMLKNKSLSVLV